jgi:hypothetical protein
MTDTYVQHYRPDPQHGPVEHGQRLATFVRGRHGEEQLRVNLCEYEGHPYVSIRLWTKGQDGSWWPTKKGTSVRMAECSELAEVLANVARQHESARLAGPDRRQDPLPGARGSSRWGGRQPQRSLPAPRDSAGSDDRHADQGPPFEPGRFTEFDGDE